MFSRFTHQLALGVSGSLLLLSLTARAQPAELVIQHAHVLTMDPARPQATAVAVRDHRIVYVGDDAGLGALIGPHTRVVSSGAETTVTKVR